MKVNAYKCYIECRKLKNSIPSCSKTSKSQPYQYPTSSLDSYYRGREFSWSRPTYCTSVNMSKYIPARNKPCGHVGERMVTLILVLQGSMHVLL